MGVKIKRVARSGSGRGQYGSTTKPTRRAEPTTKNLSRYGDWNPWDKNRGHWANPDLPEHYWDRRSKEGQSGGRYSQRKGGGRR